MFLNFLYILGNVYYYDKVKVTGCGVACRLVLWRFLFTKFDVLYGNSGGNGPGIVWCPSMRFCYENSVTCEIY